VPYKRLFIFVEGPYDKKFFTEIVIPKLRNKYDLIKCIVYAEEEPKEIYKQYIKSIKSMGEYIFVTDLDEAPCVTSRKNKKQEIYNQKLDDRRIIVVKKEIESWIIAGITEQSRRKLRIRGSIPSSTENFKKEQFKSLQPSKFDSEIDFRAEILKKFSVDQAKNRNASFKYFFNKFIENNTSPC